MQIRGIEDVSAVSVLGTVGMMVALTIAAIKICLTPRAESYRHVSGFRHLPIQSTLCFLICMAGLALQEVHSLALREVHI